METALGAHVEDVRWGDPGWADEQSRRSEVAFLAKVLKAPRIAACCEHLARRAVEEGWDHPTYLAAVLAEETAGRPMGASTGSRAARFPQVKTLDDFDFAFQRSVKRRPLPTWPSSTSWPRPRT